MSFSVYILQSITFLDLLAIGLIVPLVPNRVRSLGGNHIDVGLLGSIYAIFQLGSGPLIGSLSDLRGRREILLITLIVCSLAYTLTGFLRSVIGILCLRAVLGLFKQTQMLARAMVPEYEASESKQSEIFGKMAAISGIGITVGPIIGGHMIESHPENGFKYVSMIVGLCFLINAGLAYLLLTPSSVKLSRRKKEKTKRKSKVPKAGQSQSIVQYACLSLKQSVVELLSIKWVTYWDVFILKFLIGLAMGIYYSNYASYLATVYTLTPKYIGYMISWSGIVGSLSSFFIGYINKFYQNDEDFSLRNLHVFTLTTLSIGGLILSRNVYMYMFWLVPLAVSNAVGRLTSLEMMLKRARGCHRGSLIGASNSTRSLAGVIAPMTAGLISQYVGVSYPIYVSFLATLVGLCVSYYSRNYATEDDDFDDDEDYEYYNNRKYKAKTE